MLKTNAIFFRKVSELETQTCVIETIQLMNQTEYDELSKGLLRHRSFIMMGANKINRQYRFFIAAESGYGIKLNTQTGR